MPEGGSALAAFESFPDDAPEIELREKLEAYTAKQLRAVCVSLHMKVQSRALANFDNKVGYIQLLCQHRQRRLEASEDGRLGPRKLFQHHRSQLKEPRKTKNSSIRLINLMFSDAFCDRLGEINAKATRDDLDTGAVNARSRFWTDAAAAYSSKDTELDVIISSRAAFDDLAPADAPKHSAEKLFDMWKALCSQYDLCKSNSVQSGTHESDFEVFCRGRVDVLYLHEWLQLRPQLLSRVESKLPKRARVDTEGSQSGEDYSDKSSARSTPTKRSRQMDDIVNLLKADQPTPIEKAQESIARTTSIVEGLYRAIAAIRSAGGDSALATQMEQRAERLSAQLMKEIDGAIE